MSRIGLGGFFLLSEDYRHMKDLMIATDCRIKIVMKKMREIDNREKDTIQHIFIIGAKSIGHYGGFETFVDRLLREHENENSIKYHIACKANGNGFMDESKLDSISVLKGNKRGEVCEFEYKGAHVFKVVCPNIGSAVAIYYDLKSLLYSINYCKVNKITHPCFYILTCRIGLFIKRCSKGIKNIGGVYYLNPDGHEWMRAKWSWYIKKYWKWSEKKMVIAADIVICDSLAMEEYIKQKYEGKITKYISYGADLKRSLLKDDDQKFKKFLEDNMLRSNNYYMCCGRFVPENSFEVMIREFMKSYTCKDFVIITTKNDKLLSKIDSKLHFNMDKRIKFVGEVYDKELLKKIRENAFGNMHGHTVGGTNPSLLEALSATRINLLIDVPFNREVAGDAAFYWNKTDGNLAKLINEVDSLGQDKMDEYACEARRRIETSYSWNLVGREYADLWCDISRC